MPKLVCRIPGGYSGFSGPDGAGRVVSVADGDELEVTAWKAEQLARDFPGGFEPVDDVPADDAGQVPARRGRRAKAA